MSNNENNPVYLEKGESGIATIYLNQPRKKNAISGHMMELLQRLLYEADRDDEIRVIVLRGSGENFTSGGDLSQTKPEEATPENSRKTFRRYMMAQSAIRSIAKPVIAMVDGYAVGGGFALMLACDLVCVSNRATVVPAFCQIGIAPEMGIVKYLPQIVGAQRAKEIIFLGDRISGTQLYEMGIANRVCSAEDLERVTAELAHRLSAMPDISIQVAKGMMNALDDTDLMLAMTMEQTASPFCTTTAAYAATQAKYAK